MIILVVLTDSFWMWVQVPHEYSVNRIKANNHNRQHTFYLQIFQTLLIQVVL